MKLFFGKYAGQSIQSIADNDINYLVWVEQNIASLSKKTRDEINYFIELKLGKSASRGFVSKTATEALEEKRLRKEG